MKVMVKEDMAAHKMVTMLERMDRANRDIFDTYFFLKNNWPINEQIIEKKDWPIDASVFKKMYSKA